MNIFEVIRDGLLLRDAEKLCRDKGFSVLFDGEWWFENSYDEAVSDIDLRKALNKAKNELRACGCCSYS